ncbi:MAG: methyltransferase domain-containing protein [Arcobacteraceae bacterium]
MELPNSYWDKLASRYPRYTDESIRRDARFIFGVANDFGVEFEDKTILDIGCGTGTLAIPLASKASKITALDLSQPMLDIFANDITTLSLDNKVDIILSSWDDFELSQTYDIAIASMTPAVSSIEHFDKFISSTSFYGIFVGWGDYKNNDIVDILIEKHNASKSKTFGQTQKFINHLMAKNIHHTSSYFETSWSDDYSFDDAFEYCISHLERFGIKANESIIKETLQTKQQNDKITFTTNAQKGVVVFTHSTVR